MAPEESGALFVVAFSI